MGTKTFSHNLIKRFPLLMMLGALLLTSCIENSGVRAKKTLTGSGLTGTGGTGSGSGSLPNGSGVGSSDTTLQSVKVELSHLVDPFDGTYKKKLTIPKNYKGNLYLAGLNVGALQNKLVKVRFNFGLDKQPVVLDATIARAPGIVPQTDIQVLVVDMNSKPFSKMRLGYDLFDYNDYTALNSDGTEKAVVQNNRDGGLYCRGLSLEDDPTFDSSTSTNATCSQAGDKCLYAYAKVTDATMYDSSTGLTTIPTRPQIWTVGSGVTRSPTLATSANSMCLPDYEDYVGFNDLFAQTLTGLNYNDLILGMRYRGPYRAINPSAWKITGNAIFNSSKGLFEVSNSTLDPYTGFRSLLFPRAGKVKLNQDVRYFGSSSRFGLRSTLVADSTGTSKYVDGCNLRVMQYDVTTAENVGSCNVNGSIEVFYMKDGSEVNITTDRTIKLQLVKASTVDSEGKEVLTSNFKRCESSSTCGSDECCFNSRCWSKELVTQCVDQTPVNGNRPVGDVCSSDFECSSLCCNQSTGSCQPHNPSGTTPVLCSKTAGQRCVSREFCKPEYVATCKIVKNGTNADGTQACTLRCPAVETYGECTAGYCIPPAVPAIPAFDPTDCSQAVDP
nr:hypothetical protein BHI3_23530 [Bacteriovorax sp. HI3]